MDIFAKVMGYIFPNLDADPAWMTWLKGVAWIALIVAILYWQLPKIPQEQLALKRTSQRLSKRWHTKPPHAKGDAITVGLGHHRRVLRLFGHTFRWRKDHAGFKKGDYVKAPPGLLRGLPILNSNPASTSNQVRPLTLEPQTFRYDDGLFYNEVVVVTFIVTDAYLAVIRHEDLNTQVKTLCGSVYRTLRLEGASIEEACLQLPQLPVVLERAEELGSQVMRVEVSHVVLAPNLILPAPAPTPPALNGSHHPGINGKQVTLSNLPSAT